MLPGRTYALRVGDDAVDATISPLKYRVDPLTGERAPASRLEHGETGVCGLQLERQIAFDPTAELALLDQITDERVGTVRLHFALRRSDNISWQELDVDKHARGERNEQLPCVLWLTGLSGAGKSTIANHVERRLHALRPAHVSPRRRQRATRVEQRPRLHRGGSRREHPPRRGGREADGRRRVDRDRCVHLAVRERAADGAKPRRRRRVHRDPCRHAARSRRGARSEGPLCEGAQRRAHQLHRDRLTVRAAGVAGGASRHDAASTRGGGATRRRCAARPRAQSWMRAIRSSRFSTRTRCERAGEAHLEAGVAREEHLVARLDRRRRPGRPRRRSRCAPASPRSRARSGRSGARTRRAARRRGSRRAARASRSASGCPSNTAFTILRACGSAATTSRSRTRTRCSSRPAG